jgi:hypothetical protein
MRRGASRSSGDVARDAMDALTAPDERGRADGEVVWSWSPDAGIKLVNDLHGRRWQKSPVHRREHEVSRNTIAQGMPECSGVPVVTLLVCFFHSHTRLRVRQTPGIPCTLPFREGKTLQKLGHSCRGNGGSRLTRCHRPARPGDPETVAHMRDASGILDAPLSRRMTASCPAR